MSMPQTDLGIILENARSQMGKSIGLQSNALDYLFNELSSVIIKQQEEIKRLNGLLAKKVDVPSQPVKLAKTKIEPPPKK